MVWLIFTASVLCILALSSTVQSDAPPSHLPPNPTIKPSLPQFLTRYPTHTPSLEPTGPSVLPTQFPTGANTPFFDQIYIFSSAEENAKDDCNTLCSIIGHQCQEQNFVTFPDLFEQYCRVNGVVVDLTLPKNLLARIAPNCPRAFANGPALGDLWNHVNDDVTNELGGLSRKGSVYNSYDDLYNASFFDDHFHQNAQPRYEKRPNVNHGLKSNFARITYKAIDIGKCYSSTGVHIPSPTFEQIFTDCWTGGHWGGEITGPFPPGLNYNPLYNTQHTFLSDSFKVGSNMHDPSFYINNNYRADWFYNPGDHIPQCSAPGSGGSDDLSNAYNRLCPCGLSEFPTPPSPTPPKAAPTPTPTAAAPIPTSTAAPIPTTPTAAPIPTPTAAAPIPTPTAAAPIPTPTAAAPIPTPTAAAPIPTTPTAAPKQHSDRTKKPNPTPSVPTKSMHGEHGKDNWNTKWRHVQTVTRITNPTHHNEKIVRSQRTWEWKKPPFRLVHEWNSTKTTVVSL